MATVQKFDVLLSETVPECALEQDSGGENTDTSEDEDQGTSMDDDNDEKVVESDMEVEEEDENGSDNSVCGNPGWADAMAKILKTNKPKGKKSIVLAKAKKLNIIKKMEERIEPNVGFEILDEIKEEKSDITSIKPKEEKIQVKRKRKEWEAKGRVKPSPLDKTREKTLSKIATKGVVQLFNAVRQHQKLVDLKLKEVGPSETKRDKVMKSINKQTFLNVLLGSTTSEAIDNPVKQDSDIKEENVEPPTWQVLRSDFMMGAKLKDWDKKDQAPIIDVDT